MSIILFLIKTDKLDTTMLLISPVQKLGLERVISNSLQIGRSRAHTQMCLIPEP